MTILSIASAAGSLAAQEQGARYQSAANQRQYQNTLATANANYAQTALEQQQQVESAQQKIQENDRKARAAAATARTSAGESGISGLSVDALLADIGTEQNRYDTSVMTNLDRQSTALQNQRDNVYASASSQINGLKSPAMPDYFGAALRIGGDLDRQNKLKVSK
jgi:hypothetical protein